jgi:hypothetical protein
VKDHVKERIIRGLETLSDERGYQILDYVEFLGSKYGERASPTGIFAQITDTVEDTMRAGKLPLDAISGTVKFFGGATKVMNGLASAAQAVVDETTRTLSTPARPSAAPAPPKAADPKATDSKVAP